ncbi:MAG: hypothetical protein WDM94_15690 [Bauldia sp.]
MATGLNVGLRHTLGITRYVVSPNHSITIGFDLTPVGRPRFAFPALTVYPSRLDERIAYLSMFPVGDTMRANFFVYRDMRDPWLKAMRHAPVATLLEAMPELAELVGPFAVDGDVKIRPVDLTVTGGHRQAGIVVIGDAFATSCPAAGTGSGKALTDAERLCHLHIPAWLATPGMDAEKNRGLLRRPRQAGLRRRLDRDGPIRPLDRDGYEHPLAGPPLRQPRRPPARRSKTPRSPCRGSAGTPADIKFLKGRRAYSASALSATGTAVCFPAARAPRHARRRL